MYKNNLLKLIAFVLFYSGILRIVRRLRNNFQSRNNKVDQLVPLSIKKKYPQKVQILGYHRVNDGADPFFPPISTKVFTRHMDYLASTHNILPLEEAVERMNEDDVPANAVVVTFDDGYRDNYLNAFPILQKLSIPATIFIATDALDSRRVLWHDRVFSAFRETRVPFLKDFPDSSREYCLKTIEEKLFAQREILKFLRSLDKSERLLWIARLTDELEVTDRRDALNLMMTWDDAKVMCKNGISFGSHTITHPVLSTLSGDEAALEIYESKRTIEQKLGITVKTFAYPGGKKEDFSVSTKGILKEAGYTCAVSAIFGINGPGQDLFELRRGTPWEEFLPVFATKLEWYSFGSHE